MSENSIKFSLSNSKQRDSWLNSSHRTLDADTLEWINFRFQNFPSNRDRVSDDNNVMDIIDIHGRNEANVNSHEFCFDGRDINRLGLQLVNNGVVGPNVSSCCCDM